MTKLVREGHAHTQMFCKDNYAIIDTVEVYTQPTQGFYHDGFHL